MNYHDFIHMSDHFRLKYKKILLSTRNYRQTGEDKRKIQGCAGMV